MRDVIKLAVVLMVFNLVAGSLLAYVYIKTKPVIEARKLAGAGDSTGEVLPDMKSLEPHGEGTEFQYWIGYSDAGKKNPAGYALISRQKGYSSMLEIMIGVDIDGVIQGVKVLFQQETPGLGDKIEEIKAGESDPWFTRQFIGTSALENLSVTKDGGTIDAISGATISSRAVCAAITNGIKQLIEVNGEDTFSVKVDASELVAAEAPEWKPTEITDNLLTEVLTGMSGGYKKQDEGTDLPYWTGYKDSNKSTPGGYVFVALAEGFASTIETLVGVDTGGKIIGIKILSHGETEGYGDRVNEIREGEKKPWFQTQFLGKSASDTIALKEDGGGIDALTGATITSRAVTKSINIEIKKLMGKITGKVFEIPDTPKAETSEQPSNDALAKVLPDMIGDFVLQNEGSEFPYWIGYNDFLNTEPGGYIFIANGEGFASIIRTLVGINTEGTITGVTILSHEETEGYGDKVGEIRQGESEPWFPRQFVGKSSADNISLTVDGGVIDALTEATITSKAVTESIDKGIKKLKGIISGEIVVEEKGESEGEAVVMPSDDDLARVLPDMIGEYKIQDEGSDFPYWIGYTDFLNTEPGGYIFIANGEGFASTIRTLVGVNTVGVITGVKILFQEETEGYGDKVGEIRQGESEPWFP
ncbi:MAG: RnfABCDGE type electron transport complex subunit G, partial [Candidatus Latescibacteria bacterium]|nr:RnfABCDGE type electron transport complex subunit G [Candidatus Latescibacterota bacterium]